MFYVSKPMHTARDVQIVFDQDVLAEEWYGCSDGRTTGCMKLRTDDIVHRLLPYAKHSCKVIAM